MALSVIITAAGSSKRMGGVNKLMLPLGGKPVLAHSLELFDRLAFVDRLVITASANNLEAYRELCAEYCTHKEWVVLEGGKERQDSIAVALRHLAQKGCSFVAVHDGARPLVSRELVARLYMGLLRGSANGQEFPSEVDVDLDAQQWLDLEKALQVRHRSLHRGFKYADLSQSRLMGRDSSAPSPNREEILGVIPGVAVKDTIKKVDKFGRVQETLVRSELRAVQTPQIFQFDPLQEAYFQAELEGFLGTDDASLVERCGGQVLILPGDYTNLKITTVDDIALAGRLLEEIYA